MVDPTTGPEYFVYYLSDGSKLWGDFSYDLILVEPDGTIVRTHEWDEDPRCHPHLDSNGAPNHDVPEFVTMTPEEIQTARLLFPEED